MTTRRGAAAGVVAGVVIVALIGLTLFLLRAISSKNRDLEALFNYEAPTLIFDKVALPVGASASEVMKQVPVRLPDGEVEDNKAIIVARGDLSEGNFVQNPQGERFMLTLLVDGEPKGTATGLLLPGGFGTAIWCRDADGGGDHAHGASGFNCFFKVTLEPDGAVRVHWTMFHRD